MLITELKNKDVIKSQLQGKVFVLVCHGCKEIKFPEHEADALITQSGTLVSVKAGHILAVNPILTAAGVV